MGTHSSKTTKSDQHNPIKVKISFDCFDISTCQDLDYFATIMNKYNQLKHLDMEKIDIKQLLDIFLHLLHQHNSDQDFELVYNKLTHCNLAKCNIYNRLNNTYHDKNNNKNQLASCQILDKIHCHYQHCYDIGNRLNSKDTMNLQQNIHNLNDEKQERFIDEELINKRVMAFNQILSVKRKSISEFNDVVYNRINKKYNASFYVNPEATSTKQLSLYSFGFEFYYRNEAYHGPNAVFAKPKYFSLKAELILNQLSTITKAQYDIEYKKAKIHFDSNYCKIRYKERSDSLNQTYPFRVEYVLSLMIYCNFTELQYQFSKTYRNKVGIQHNNFYNLGYYLQTAVHKFGRKLKDSSVETFYHGVGEQLLFPEYIGSYCDGISINCPLSTSSSLAVAMNFTNNNNGLIIEFSDIHYPNTTKCFAVSWLSNYGNESEYLFIQMGLSNGKLNVNNIIDLKTGCEYKLILDALNAIQQIMNCEQGSRNPLQVTCKSVDAMVVQIVSNRLSSGQHAVTYKEKLINSYFINTRIIEMNFEIFRKEPQLQSMNLFFYSLKSRLYEWIKLEKIMKLFTNVKTIKIYNINICSSVLQDLFEYLHKHKQPLQIVINATKHTKCLVQSLGFEYEKKFNEINFECCYNESTFNINLIANHEEVYIGNTHKYSKTNKKQKNCHKWKLFMTTSPDDVVNPKSIQHVTYYLHPTFSPSVVVRTESPFILVRHGWGIFNVMLKIKFHKQYNRKDVFCSYLLNFVNDVTIKKINENSIDEYYRQNNRLWNYNQSSS